MAAGASLEAAAGDKRSRPVSRACAHASARPRLTDTELQNQIQQAFAAESALAVAAQAIEKRSVAPSLVTA